MELFLIAFFPSLFLLCCFSWLTIFFHPSFLFYYILLVFGFFVLFPFVSLFIHSIAFIHLFYSLIFHLISFYHFTYLVPTILFVLSLYYFVISIRFGSHKIFHLLVSFPPLLRFSPSPFYRLTPLLILLIQYFNKSILHSTYYASLVTLSLAIYFSLFHFFVSNLYSIKSRGTGWES